MIWQEIVQHKEERQDIVNELNDVVKNSNQLAIQYYISAVNVWYPLRLNQNEF